MRIGGPTNENRVSRNGQNPNQKRGYYRPEYICPSCDTHILRLPYIHIYIVDIYKYLVNKLVAYQLKFVLQYVGVQADRCTDEALCRRHRNQSHRNHAMHGERRRSGTREDQSNLLETQTNANIIHGAPHATWYAPPRGVLKETKRRKTKQTACTFEANDVMYRTHHAMPYQNTPQELAVHTHTHRMVWNPPPPDVAPKMRLSSSFTRIPALLSL